MKKASTYGFGDFELHGDSEQLFYQGSRLKLEPQLFALLMLLLEHRGELLSRQQIQDTVWAGRPVTDEAIRVAIKKLRDLLGDDARAPRFVKTIPKQGYKWLAPVTTPSESEPARHSRTAKQWTGLRGARGWLGWLVAGLFVAALALVAIRSAPRAVSENAQQVQVTSLTTLEGSEIFADYHAADNKLVFLHREAAGSPQQLYTKSLTSGEVQRLSWDGGHYSNSYWSPDGRQLAFNRSAEGRPGLYVADIDKHSGVTGVEQISHPDLSGKFVIGWLQDQTGLLLAEELTAGRQHSIYQYNLAEQELRALSFPNVAGRGDYLASQAHDGSKLAILREVGKEQVSLVVMAWQSGRILANKSLPFTATRLAWHHDNDTVLLSSFLGDSSRYRIQIDAFEPHPALPENSLDIYASCGDRCYILRRHNGNFLDIQETPLDISVSESLAVEVEPVLVSGRMLRQPGAQDFPRYVGEGGQFVFVSLLDQHLVFQHLDNEHRLQELGRLDPGLQLSAFSVAADGNRIAGVVEGRLILLDTNPGSTGQDAPRFLTHGLERVANPIWHADNRHLYLAHFAGNEPTIVLMDTQTQERQSIMTGMLSFRGTPDDPALAVGIDANRMAWRLFLEDGNWVKQQALVQLESANPHRWQLRDDKIYFSRYQGRESQLCWLSIAMDSSGQAAQCRSTGPNRFRLNFDIHPINKTILMVESLSAQSDIARMTW